MQPFNFATSSDASEAIANHAKSPLAQFIAGGTTLMDLMKLHVEAPNLVVDITPVPLNKISSSNSQFEIGALVSNTDLAMHPQVRAEIPMLSQAILSGASPQLRNLATVGGNLLQRTRCSYFRDTAFACNKRSPGSGCPALHGENRGHAVLGTSESCVATHASDFCVALIALDAEIEIQGTQGKRKLKLSEFYREPGRTPQIENALAKDELIVNVTIQKQNWFKRSAYLKIRDRASYAFALTSAAVALELEGKTVRSARIGLGGVATVPWRSHEAEKFLVGKTLDKETAFATARLAFKDAKALEQNRFKIPLGERTLARTLLQVGELT